MYDTLEKLLLDQPFFVLDNFGVSYVTWHKVEQRIIVSPFDHPEPKRLVTTTIVEVRECLTYHLPLFNHAFAFLKLFETC